MYYKKIDKMIKSYYFMSINNNNCCSFKYSYLIIRFFRVNSYNFSYINNNYNLIIMGSNGLCLCRNGEKEEEDYLVKKNIY